MSLDLSGNIKKNFKNITKNQKPLKKSQRQLNLDTSQSTTLRVQIFEEGDGGSKLLNGKRPRGIHRQVSQWSASSTSSRCRWIINVPSGFTALLRNDQLDESASKFFLNLVAFGYMRERAGRGMMMDGQHSLDR